MNRDEILSMAREAGIEVHPRKEIARIGLDVLTGCDSTDKLAKFAELATAKERTARIEAQVENDALKAPPTGKTLSTDYVALKASQAGIEAVTPEITLFAELLTRSERAARIEAQQRLADMQELLAKDGLAHSKAVQAAVREALQEAKKACENLPAPEACTGVERSLWDVATMACAEAVGNLGTR